MSFLTRKALLLICSVAAGLTNVGLANRLYAQTCASHLELVNSTDDELEDAVPCDFIGAAYMIGLGYGSSGYYNNADSGKYSYYPIFRFYLEMSNRKGGPPSSDAIAFLIVAAQDLTDVEDSERDSRFYSYRAFVLGAYWDANIEGIRESRDLVADYFSLLLTLSVVSSYDELKCFIEADLPTLAIQQIMSSDRYTKCVARSA